MPTTSQCTRATAITNVSHTAHRPARTPKAVAAARERDNLRAAPAHRDVIWQAKGALSTIVVRDYLPPAESQAGVDKHTI